MTLPSRTLRNGSGGDDVVVLQTLLNRDVPKSSLPRAKHLVVDGAFGSNTDSGVRSFQKIHKLTVDGIVGPKTWGAFAGDGGTVKDPAKAPKRPDQVAPIETPVPGGKPRATIFFRRTGDLGNGGAVLGEMSLDGEIMATVERGNGYTFVRQGTYQTTMDTKNTGRPVKCLRFDEDPAIASHLVHDAYNDSHLNLEGCIAPGTLKADGSGITGSAAAMNRLMAKLGGYAEGAKVKIIVENNVVGDEGKDDWINRRRTR